MRILGARYRNGDEFLRHYQPSFPDGGLFFPTRESIGVGSAVLLEIAFPDLPQKQLVRGRVAWQRNGRHRTKLRAGLGIEFLADEAERRDFLLSVARKEAGSVTARRHKRLPVDLTAKWRVADERDLHQSRVEDIGTGGAFLRTPETLPRGTEIFLDILPPGSVMPLAIAARVAWVRTVAGDEGFGVEFRSREGGGMRRLKELVRRIEEEIRTSTIESVPGDEGDDLPDGEGVEALESGEGVEALESVDGDHGSEEDASA